MLNDKYLFSQLSITIPRTRHQAREQQNGPNSRHEGATKRHRVKEFTGLNQPTIQILKPTSRHFQAYT